MRQGSLSYNTDQGVTEENAEDFTRRHHSGQAAVYHKALAQGSGLPVREVVFAYCRAGSR